MSTRMAGKALTDLGFTPERMEELKGYAQGLQTGGKVSEYSDDYGFAAETENNFRELDDPTEGGSLQADMRKIGQHLGYEHSGTLNPQTVKDFILGKQTNEAAPAQEEGIVYSDKTAKAKAGVAAYDKVIRPYQGDYIMGRKTTNPSDDFMAEYNLQLENYKQPRDPNQIDGGLYNPDAEEAAVAGAMNDATPQPRTDFDFDADAYYRG